jgi:hypothetical protein
MKTYICSFAKEIGGTCDLSCPRQEPSTLENISITSLVNPKNPAYGTEKCGNDVIPICVEFKHTPLRYKLLKPVSIYLLEKEGACETELNKFAFLAAKQGYDYSAAIDKVDVIKIAEQCKNGISWLVNNGFISVEKEKEVFYKAGQRFKYNDSGTSYILATIGVDENKKALVQLISLTDGNRWTDVYVPVSDLKKITEEEFFRITNKKSHMFTAIVS